MMQIGRFGVIPAAWLERGDLGANEIAVLACLSAHATRDGWCYPGQKRIASQIQKSRPTVNAIIKKLVEAGLIEQHRRRRDNGGQSSSLYRIRYDAALSMPGKTESKPPVGEPTPPVSASTGPDEGSTPPVDGSTESPGLESPPPETSAPGFPQGGSGEAPATVVHPEQFRRPVPDGWRPCKADIEWAQRTFPGIDAEAEAERWTFIAQAQGWRYASFGSAWKAWLAGQKRNFDKESSHEKAGPGGEYRKKRRRNPRGRGQAQGPGERGERNRDVVGEVCERISSRRSA